jgi:drug/metabolite transporter (DMT)-like permease
MRLRLAPFALLSVAAIWGGAFVMMKDALKRQDVSSFLFTRFLIAFLAMILVRPNIVRLLSKDLIVKGVIAGSFLGSGFILQTFGLAKTTAAITGFITGLYVVATPLIAGVFLRQKISLRIWICVVIATIGLALLSLHGWSMGIGEILVLASAVAYACHIIALGQWSLGRDAYAFTTIQLGTVTFICGIASFARGYRAPPDAKVWEVVIFTALFATVFAFFIQTWSQAHLSSSKIAVIISMEGVFAAFFAVVFGGETLTAQKILGGLLVFVAMYMILLQNA